MERDADAAVPAAASAIEWRSVRIVDGGRDAATARSSLRNLGAARARRSARCLPPGAHDGRA